MRFILSAAALSLLATPVSYTHLDVYKRQPYDGNPATVGNGVRIAVAMEDRAKVETLYAKALTLGGSCEGGPGVRGNDGDQAFYGAYFRDLDGNKICAFSIGPAAT